MRDKDVILGNFIDAFPKKMKMDVDSIFRAALLEVLLDVRDSILLAAGLVDVSEEAEDADESNEEQGS